MIRQLTSPLFYRLILVLSVLSLGLLARLSPLRVNLSASMPKGVYAEARRLSASKGSFIEACLPQPWSCFGVARGYLAPGGPCSCGAVPVVKEVVAEPGDVVEIDDVSVRIDDREYYSPRFSQDRKGRPLPSIPIGRYRISTGQVWLQGLATPTSWDSRYFGPVTLSHVLSVLKPVWTWNSK